ncbi:MAG: TOBE domain-containing protein [Methanobacteriaceae archaeon]|jgi:molybdopterin-binding protein|nr:TOBE domain-containing protein [Methanobacteriaceae archaeon]MDO9043736.1 TOBE domain-containing protein [Methanobacteriaceae archaeon]MDO9627696.1 TOBE domain-containing protein [Methanobacteriaceae archaeon]MDP2836961.1 TOBE domain-containing protein [Methanobacteriaceae archaeon]MDP3034910.1 TOBE domain-containing protein [Methanobacteriaceae archaeon]
MKISARNSLKGKVEEVKEGVVTATIKMKIETPGEITATITKEAVEDLGLKVGDEVMAIIKSSEVMIAKK